MNGTVSGLFINSTVDPKVASVEYEGTVTFPRGGKNAYSDVKLDKPTNEHTGKWLGDSVDRKRMSVRLSSLYKDEIGACEQLHEIKAVNSSARCRYASGFLPHTRKCRLDCMGKMSWQSVFTGCWNAVQRP